jgi:hypothetical protein
MKICIKKIIDATYKHWLQKITLNLLLKYLSQLSAYRQNNTY